MEDKELNLTSTCEIDQDISKEDSEKSLTSIEATSNAAYQDEKGDLGGESVENNTILTFSSTSVTSQTIKVYLRLKPFAPETDLTREQEDAYTIVNPTTLVAKFPGLDVYSRSLKNLKARERVCRTFTFTNAFGPDISQAEFFDASVKSQICNFLTGQNATIMSYGTSNAGKSYTLYGVPSALGIIPLSIRFIFGRIKATLATPWYKPIHQSDVIGLSSNDRVRELEIRDKLLSFTSPEKTEFINAYQEMGETTRDEEKEGEGLTPRQDKRVIYSVWISFAEIYNDAMYDLLSYDWQKKRLPLKMVTDNHGRTFIKDLKTVYVNSGEEAYQILLAGHYRSRVAATTLNPRSSRSHCIFTIKLLKYNAESTPNDVEVSALSFCDLAGSGRLKMTTNIRDRLKETQNINTSLLVLGRCLKSIWEGQSLRQKSELIGPFRESKLTRLFQKSLCGKEQMTLIVNVNPVPNLYAETQNVLNFSSIAKKIIVEPVKEYKKKIFTSRFSRVVSRSVKTVTDWDHAVAEESAQEIYPEKVDTSSYIPRECYDDLSTDYEKLKNEHAALKASMIDKDLEIREEMANTYTELINNLEASWISRSKDAEEQQEHLLNWSVNQVENFYKEKLNRLNSRKRRRWDNGDAVDDREADIREMETENETLTAKILVTKETIKELRSARENAIAEKNKALFELSLVKKEIIDVKKMLDAAENDIRCEEDGANFIHELKKQLNNRQERIKNLKEFLNEAKEEYIRITSDAGRMQEELKEANETLIENAEKIEDLEDQLDQSDIFLAQRTNEIEQFKKKFEHQSKQLAEFEERAKNSEEKLKESEAIRLNLIGAVEDLNKLHKISSTHAFKNCNNFQQSSTDSDTNIGYGRNITDIEKPQIVKDTTDDLSEDLPVRLEFRTKDRLGNIGNLVTSLEGLKGEKMEMQDTDIIILNADDSIHKENENSFKLSISSVINDSGIAVSMGSENQTLDQMNSIVETDSEAECDVNSANEVKIHKLQNEVSELEERLLHPQPRHKTVNSTTRKNNSTLRDLEERLTELEIAVSKCQKREDEQNDQLLDSIARLTSLEIQFQSTLCKKSENNSEMNLLEVGDQISAVNVDFRQSENINDGEFENQITSLQNAANHKMHIFKTKNTSWRNDASSNTIDLLIAPTSTPRGETNSDMKPTLTASLSKIPSSLRNSLVCTEKKCAMSMKKDCKNSRSKPLEVHSILRGREMILIIFLIIVFFIDLV